MSIPDLLLYLTVHHITLEGHAFGAGYVVMKATASDPVLAELVDRWQNGDTTVLDDLAMQLVCEHPEAVDAMTGTISALSHAAKLDPGLKQHLWAVIKRK